MIGTVMPPPLSHITMCTVLDNTTFQQYLAKFKTIFSNYLLVNKLLPNMNASVINFLNDWSISQYSWLNSYQIVYIFEFSLRLFTCADFNIHQKKTFFKITILHPQKPSFRNFGKFVLNTILHRPKFHKFNNFENSEFFETHFLRFFDFFCLIAFDFQPKKILYVT